MEKGSAVDITQGGEGRAWGACGASAAPGRGEGTSEEGGGLLSRLVSGLQLHTMPGAAFSIDPPRLDPAGEAGREPAGWSQEASLQGPLMMSSGKQGLKHLISGASCETQYAVN